MPLTSSGAICVPSSERHGMPTSFAAWYTISDLPTPGGESSRKLCSCAMHCTSFFACFSVMVSSIALRAASMIVPPRLGVAGRSTAPRYV